MDPIQRKKASVITKYAVEAFSDGDWLTLGQITDHVSTIQQHPRLLRSLSFGDDDYEYCVAEVLNQVLGDDSSLVDDVIDHFDIDLWYEQKEPERFRRVFAVRSAAAPDFWKPGYLRAFVSHLSESQRKVGHLRNALETWGISCFIAHQDIEPSREWQAEIEAGLSSMQLMIALIEPGFTKSGWTDQEIGFALGRDVDVVPLLIDGIPHGFIGKIQGIQVKGRLPSDVATEVVRVVLRKPRHRRHLLAGLSQAMLGAASQTKIDRIGQLDNWGTVSNEQMRNLLERSGLSDQEKSDLEEIITKVNAFKAGTSSVGIDDDIPF